MLTPPAPFRRSSRRARPLLKYFSLLTLGVALVTVASAQGGGGRVIPGGGGVIPGGGGVIPGGGGATPTLRVVADTGILAGEPAQAIAAGQTAAPGGAAVITTYQWTISGGRITTDATRATITYVADVAGTVSLNVVVTTNGVAASASADVTAISAATAGAMTVASTLATSVTSATATVPAAQSADRTFRWTLAGAGAAVISGQNTNSLTFRPGTPGLLSVTCEVTLQRIVTVPLRSFLVVTGDGAPVAVTINNGSGSATVPAASRLDIFANPPPAGQVFDKWTGDTAALGTGALAPFLAHAVITVPATPVALTATYKAAPAWTPTVVTGFNPIAAVTPNGITLISYIPAAAKGLVVLFHDTGGNAASWFNTPESVTLARDLVAAGYGVAALNSANRNTGAWSAQTVLANNPDVTDIAAALDKFARDGLLAATKPVFFLGNATGGDAAARYAEQLATATPARPIKGAVLYCATGSETLAVTAAIPQFFALAANDDQIGTAGNTTARAHSTLLAGRGLATAVTSSTASPVHSGRFRALGTTSATFTAADATAIWNAVKTAGLLDANNYLKAIPTNAALNAALPAAYQTRTADVAAQLAVAYAAQEFYSDADARVIAFLDARVANTPAPAPGRLINLSTRTKISFVGDNFVLGFNIVGAQKATLLIRGIGPALVKFGVPGALTAPRLEVNSGATVIASNEGWDKPVGTAATAAQIVTAATSVGAFALAAGDRDAAVLLTLDPGPYTVTMKGLNGTTGDVLAEVYDVSKNGTRLTNLSTLAKINTEGDLLVPGIVVEGANPRTLLVRAVGPGLSDFGIPASALLGDPRITVLNSNSPPQTVATNNNWAQGGATGGAVTLAAVFPAVGAFALKATNSDAALVTALTPGAFTLQAGAAPVAPNAPAGTPVANPTGTVLVEVYEVP